VLFLCLYKDRGVCADQEDGVVEVAFVKKWGWGKLKR